jgi:hypothetical protein
MPDDDLRVPFNAEGYNARYPEHPGNRHCVQYTIDGRTIEFWWDHDVKSDTRTLYARDRTDYKAGDELTGCQMVSLTSVTDEYVARDPQHQWILTRESVRAAFGWTPQFEVIAQYVTPPIVYPTDGYVYVPRDGVVDVAVVGRMVRLRWDSLPTHGVNIIARDLESNAERSLRFVTDVSGRQQMRFSLEEIRRAFNWPEPPIGTYAVPAVAGSSLLYPIPAGSHPQLTGGALRIRRAVDGVYVTAEIMTGILYMPEVAIATRPAEATTFVLQPEHLAAAVATVRGEWNPPPTMYTMPGAVSYGGGWASVTPSSAAYGALYDVPRARTRVQPKAKPKAPEPEPCVRPVGRLYDLDDE